MNPLSHWILCQTLLVAALSGPGYAATVAHQEHVDRIHVVFVAPEKFTDARRAEFKPNSEAILDAIAQFMREKGEETLPPQMNLILESPILISPAISNYGAGRNPTSSG